VAVEQFSPSWVPCSGTLRQVPSPSKMRKQRQRVIQVAGMESTFWRKRELLQMLLRPKGIAR